MDVSIADSFAAPDNNPMKIIRDRVEAKNNKYLLACRQKGLSFIPFVCGSLGGFGEDADTLMKDIGQAYAEVMGISRSQGIKYVRQRVSLALQRTQARFLVRRAYEDDIGFSRLTLLSELS